MTKSAKEKVNHYIDQCSKRLIHIKVKNEFFVEQNGIHVPNMSFLSANSSFCCKTPCNALSVCSKLGPELIIIMRLQIT